MLGGILISSMLCVYAYNFYAVYVSVFLCEKALLHLMWQFWKLDLW
jgi:hypothetical protein